MNISKEDDQLNAYYYDDLIWNIDSTSHSWRIFIWLFKKVRRKYEWISLTLFSILAFFPLLYSFSSCFFFSLLSMIINSLLSFTHNSSISLFFSFLKSNERKKYKVQIIYFHNIDHIKQISSNSSLSQSVFFLLVLIQYYITYMSTCIYLSMTSELLVVILPMCQSFMSTVVEPSYIRYEAWCCGPPSESNNRFHCVHLWWRWWQWHWSARVYSKETESRTLT